MTLRCVTSTRLALRRTWQFVASVSVAITTALPWPSRRLSLSNVRTIQTLGSSVA
jgi:hypothetical protein